MTEFQDSFCMVGNSIMEPPFSGVFDVNHESLVSEANLLKGRGTNKISGRCYQSSSRETGHIRLVIDGEKDATNEDYWKVMIRNLIDNPTCESTGPYRIQSNNHTFLMNSGSIYNWPVEGGKTTIGAGTANFQAKQTSIGSIKLKLNEAKDNGCRTSSTVLLNVNALNSLFVSETPKVGSQTNNKYSLQSKSTPPYRRLGKVTRTTTFQE